MDHDKNINIIKELGVPHLDSEQISKLNNSFTKLEIETALFQMDKEMDGYKAPGPDGIHVIFYQTFWPTVGEDLIQMVASFLNSRHMLKEFNKTTIVLIPKGEEQLSCKDFKPISLYNVASKVISKVLTNRLQHILQEVITPYQNAFAKGRSITDNVLIAHEVLRYIRRQKKGKTYWASSKIDLLKAYDKISWEFLCNLLTEMKFPNHWVNLIMQCVITVSSRVQINGALSDSFTP